MTTSQISLPSPRTWSADDLVTVPRLRADVTNAVAFLRLRPAFTGQDNSGASIANSTDTDMSLQVELTDSWNGHLPAAGGGANPWQYFAPVPGWYLCRNVTSLVPGGGATAYMTAAGFRWTTGGAASGVFRGATVINNGSAASYTAQSCDLIEQTASGAPGGSGDYIVPTIWQASGSSQTLNSSAGTLPTVSMRWVCATTGTQPLPVPPLTAVPPAITSAWLNANVRDAIRFLVYPPVCKAVYTAGSASMPNNTLGAPAVIDLTTITVDNYGGFTTGAAAKYTAPAAGVYFIYGQFNLTTSSATGLYAAGLSVNGGTAQWGDILTFNPSAAAGGGATVTRRLRLAAGDTVQLVGSQNTGAAVGYATAATGQPRFIIVWESA